MCNGKRGIEEGDHERGLSFLVHCTSWRYQDILGCKGTILVEQYEKRHCKVCGAVSNLPTSEAEHQRPVGKFKPLLVSKWKWDEIAIDFILGLPRAPTGEDFIWVVIDCLTKSAHFFPMKVKD